jgi:hypothetical protein
MRAKPTIPRVCQQCGCPFLAAPRKSGEVRRYCSYSCATRSHKRPTLTDRLWSRVLKGADCWEWQGGRTPHGYGRLYYQGHYQLTHRLVYELTYGPIPDGILVCHHCDNPCCVRPDHLFLGTQSDTMRDMTMKNRHGWQTHPDSYRGVNHWLRRYPERIRRGEDVPNARLTEDKVRDIRRVYATGTISQPQLARRFGVSQAMIDQVVTGRTWRHVN